MNALVVAMVLAAGNGETPSREPARGQALIASGAVLLGVGALGVVAGGLTFFLENEAAQSLPVVPAATPNHTLSAVLFGVGGAAAVSGAVLLIFGFRERAQSHVTTWLTPALLPSGGLGLSWGLRF